jgi:hypothetical protein
VIETYVVSGSGRVGGNLLASIIGSCNVKAIHTHDAKYATGNDQTTALIMVDRRDVFATVMSNLLVWHSDQSTQYPTQIEPYAETPEQFKLLYRLHKQYMAGHDLTRPYGLIEKFYYEDFVNNHNYVLNRLRLKSIFPITTVPAPYNYRDIIINYRELFEIYNQLEKHDHVD